MKRYINGEVLSHSTQSQISAYAPTSPTPFNFHQSDPTLSIFLPLSRYRFQTEQLPFLKKMPAKTARRVKTNLTPLFDVTGPTKKRRSRSFELSALDGSTGSVGTGGAPLSPLSRRMMTSKDTQTIPKTVCTQAEPSSPTLQAPPSSPSSPPLPSSSSLLDLQNFPLEGPSHTNRTEGVLCLSLKHQATQTDANVPRETTEEVWGEFSKSLVKASSPLDPKSQPVEGGSPASWTTDQVKAWLRSIELSEIYVQQLFEEEVNGAVLQIVSDEFLRNTLRMKLGPALWLIEKRDELFGIC